MIEVYSASSVIDAQLLCDQLISEGIDAIVRGGYLSGAAGEIPVDSLISVWISDEGQFERARQLVALMEAKLQVRPALRVCSECSEQTTSNFSHCWSCQAPLS